MKFAHVVDNPDSKTLRQDTIIPKTVLLLNSKGASLKGGEAVSKEFYFLFYH